MPEAIPAKRTAREFVIPALIVLGFAYLLVLAKGAVLPFLLSAALAYVLNPIIRYFEVRGIKRIYAVTGLYLTVGVLISVVIYLLLSFLSLELESLRQSWPGYVTRIEDAVLNLNTKLVRNYQFLSGLDLTKKLGHQLEAVPQYLVAFLPAITLSFVVPFVTFFILLGGPTLIDYLLDHLPSKHVEIILHITSRIDASLGNYLRGILTEAFIIFVLAFFGLLAIGLNYAIVIAILIGFSGMVPYAGAFVGAVLSSVVAYFQFGTLLPIIKILLFFGALRFLDDWVLQPYIMKKAVELLTQGELNVSQIAYAVGYENPNYFSRTFKKYFGVIPSKWQNRATE